MNLPGRPRVDAGVETTTGPASLPLAPLRTATRPDHARFAAFYRDEYDRMLRLAIALLYDRAVAEEVVHDAFAAVYTRWGGIDRPGAYLRTSVVNGCRGIHRREQVRRRHVPEVVPEALPPDERELLEAVAKLSPRRRAVVVLRFYEDLPEAEIAALLDIRVGTVKSTLSRALAELRTVVER